MDMNVVPSLVAAEKKFINIEDGKSLVAAIPAWSAIQASFVHSFIKRGIVCWAAFAIHCAIHFVERQDYLKVNLILLHLMVLVPHRNANESK